MKIELTDVTFLYIIHTDTVERMENLFLSTKYLCKYFKTSIMVLEVAPYNNNFIRKILNKNIKYEFIQDDDPILWRTKYLNYMLNKTKTPIVSVIDTDIIVPYKQIVDSVNALRNDDVQFVYPYKERMLDTSYIIRKLYVQCPNIRTFIKNQDKMNTMYPPCAVGGVFLCLLDAYKKLKLENERYYGWGVEDGDRFYKWNSSIFKILRIEGVIFHLSHPRGSNSIIHNEEQSNIKLRELQIVKNKSKNEITND